MVRIAIASSLDRDPFLFLIFLGIIFWRMLNARKQKTTLAGGFCRALKPLCADVIITHSPLTTRNL